MNIHYEYIYFVTTVAILHFDRQIFIAITHCTWHDSVIMIVTSRMETVDLSLQYSINDRKLLKGSDLDRYAKKLHCLCGRVGESDMLTLKTLDPYEFPSTEWIDDVLL